MVLLCIGKGFSGAKSLTILPEIIHAPPLFATSSASALKSGCKTCGDVRGQKLQDMTKIEHVLFFCVFFAGAAPQNGKLCLSGEGLRKGHGSNPGLESREP